MTTGNTQRNGTIEFLRLISYVAICFNHVAVWAVGAFAYSETTNVILKLRGWGVPLFFIINGYLLRLGERDADYELRRFKAVTPPYLVALSFMAIAYFIDRRQVPWKLVILDTWLWFVPFYLLVQAVSALCKRIPGFNASVTFLALSLAAIWALAHNPSSDFAWKFVFASAATWVGMQMAPVIRRAETVEAGVMTSILLALLVTSSLGLVMSSGPWPTLSRVLYSALIFVLVTRLPLGAWKSAAVSLAGGGKAFYYAYLWHGFICLAIVVASNLIDCGQPSVCLPPLAHVPALISVAMLLTSGIFVASSSLLLGRWTEQAARLLLGRWTQQAAR